MEIVEYLRGRWLPAFIGAPLAAAAVAGLATYSVSTPGENATGTVSVIQAVGDHPTVGPYDFKSALPAGLSADIGLGTNVKVSAHGATEKDAVKNLRDGVRAGLVALAETEQQRALIEATAAQTQADVARAKLAGLGKTSGLLDIIPQSADTSNLLKQLALAQANSDPHAADALTALLVQKTVLDSSSTNLGTTQAALAVAQARLDQVNRSPKILSVQVVERSHVSSVAEAAIPAALVSLALLVAIVLVSAGVSERRSLGLTHDGMGETDEVDQVVMPPRGMSRI